MTTQMQIYPHQGLGPLRFGMHPAEVQAWMGSDQVYEPWMGGNLNDSLLYPGLIVGFDRCNAVAPLPGSRLVEFRTDETCQLLWNGIRVNQLTLAAMQALVILGETAQLENERELVYPGLGLCFVFREDGHFQGLEMWDIHHT